MDQPGAVLGGDVVGQDDEIGVGRRGASVGGAVVGGRPVDPLVGALVGPELHLRAGEGLTGAGPLIAQNGVEQRFGDDQVGAGLDLAQVGGHLVGGGVGVGLLDVDRLAAGHHIGDVGAHRHRGVGDQGPRGGGPHQQLRLAGQRPGGERELDIDRGVAVVVVPLGQLMVGQRGAAARTVGGDPVVLAEQTLVEDLLEAPPHRLDVLGVHRPVGLVHVHPVAHPTGELGEGVDMSGDRLAALGVEGFDAVLLDVRLAGEAQLALDGQLDRQSVAVPAGLAVDVVALHGLEPGEDVLEDAGLDVMGAGLAVGGRRTLEEVPRLAVPGGLQGLLEGVVAVPQVDDLVLHRRQVDLGGHRPVGAW